jgi:type II secretory pathway pseudopilin PulG
MRRSGFNVKQFTTNYFTAQNYPDQTLPTYSYTWVTASGLRDNGAMYAGRKAQRALIVQALRAAIDVSSEAREDARIFNLLACPQYPELIQNLVVLNNDRSNTAFIIGDTPMRLPALSQPLQTYATNDLAGAQVLPEDYVTTGDPYVATYYPSCQTNNTDGTVVVQPPSHMMLRTYVRSDEASYPWFAPAGTRRGVVDNAARIGYINAQTGEFTQTNMGRDLRDILYENAINPITFIPGTGITAYGQKTRYNVGSALNRVNVARLIVYLRTQLATAVQPYLFEPNDAFTRNQVLATVTTILNDLVSKRGLYDYLAVCDESNNTPERVDRNELYVDIAVEPVKTVEFIYIPIRVKNTGEISAGA